MEMLWSFHICYVLCLCALHFYWPLRVFRLVNTIRKISHFLYRTLELNPVRDNYFVDYCRIRFFREIVSKNNDIT